MIRALRRAGLLMLIAALPARAVQITAEVDTAEARVNEQIVLTVVISGDRTDFPKPSLPSMPRFNIHNAGNSSQISIVNGRMSGSVRHRFVLVPRVVGNAIVPPISVAVDGETLQTEPIPLSILRPGDPPPAPKPSGSAARGPAPRRGQPAPERKSAPDLFVTAGVDKNRAYQNEQVLYTIRFYTGVHLPEHAQWDPPETKGFLKEDLPAKGPQEAVHNGRRYSVSEITMALFPIESGKLAIGRSKIIAKVPAGRRPDPFAADFFSQFFSRGMLQVQVKTLETKIVPVRSLPLPEGAPKGFEGAVGAFSMKASVDREKVKVGDAVNLTVTIDGRGNIKTLGDLALPELPAFRTYEPVTSLNQMKDADGVKGSKVYKFVLVPKVSGSNTIAPIPFHYFDPVKAAYVTRRTPAFTIETAAGAPPSAPVGFQASPSAVPSAVITQVTEDVRHIHRALPERPLAGLAARAAGAGWVHAFAPVLLLSCFLSAWYRERLLQDPAGVRFRGALAAAKKKVRQGREAKEPQRAAQLFADALSGYLADKLDRPSSGLTLKEAVDLIRKEKPRVPAGHVEQLKRLWNELEMFRFAPAGMYEAESASLGDGVEEALKALEEVIDR